MSHDFPRFSTRDTIDAEYRFGRPKVYLAPHDLARLSILRSKLGGTPAERAARAAGSQAAPRLPSVSE